jgi:hypothetical protein
MTALCCSTPSIYLWSAKAYQNDSCIINNQNNYQHYLIKDTKKKLLKSPHEHRLVHPLQSITLNAHHLCIETPVTKKRQQTQPSHQRQHRTKKPSYIPPSLLYNTTCWLVTFLTVHQILKIGWVLHRLLIQGHPPLSLQPRRLMSHRPWAGTPQLGFV